MREIEKEGLSLNDYWQLFNKRKSIAILILFLVVSSTYFFTKYMTPLYRSHTTVELIYETPHMLSLGSMMSSMYRLTNRDTEIRKVLSFPIISAVAKKLGIINEESSESERDKAVGRLRGKISVSVVGDTTLINIIAKDSNSDYTIKLANVVAETYVEHTIEERNERASKTRQFIEDQLNLVGEQLKNTEDLVRKYKQTGKITERISDIGSTLSKLTLKRSNLQIKYGEKHPEIVSLDKQIMRLKSTMGNLTSEELDYLYLMREMTINEELYMIFNKRLKEALIAEADKVIPVGIVDPARTAALIKPNKRINMIMGIVAGILLALIGALIQESLDTSLRSARDVETYLKVPVLAEIPFVKKVEKKMQGYPLLFSQNKNSVYTESFNTLTASIMSYAHNRDIKTILFTSMMPKEGKSEAITNFGILESQRGKKTLLIDADFRQPTLHKLFKTVRKPGIIDIITDKIDWKKCVQPALFDPTVKAMAEKYDIQNLENLSILSTGHSPPNPMRFLSSKEFTDLINSAKEEYDIILLDSPPLYYFADPTVLSGIVDAMVLVHWPGSIDRNEILRAKGQLTAGDSKFIGIALNAVKKKRRGRYYYYYYSRDRRKSKRRQIRRTC